MKGNVYHCWADEDLLYVGVSNNVQTRLLAHSKTADWWPLKTRTTLTPFDNMLAAGQAEWEAIYRDQPIFNILGKDERYMHSVVNGCDVCNSANTASLHSAGWELSETWDSMRTAYQLGLVHGHTTKGRLRLSIPDLISWNANRKATEE